MNKFILHEEVAVLAILFLGICLFIGSPFVGLFILLWMFSGDIKIIEGLLLLFACFISGYIGFSMTEFIQKVKSV